MGHYYLSILYFYFGYFLQYFRRDGGKAILHSYHVILPFILIADGAIYIIIQPIRLAIPLHCLTTR